MVFKYPVFILVYIFILGSGLNLSYNFAREINYKYISIFINTFINTFIYK